MDAEQISALRALDVAHHLPAQSDFRQVAAQGGCTIVESAKGCHIRAADGKVFLDGMAGLWCVDIGYGRTELADAAAAQMAELSFHHSFFQTASPAVVKLAAKVAALLGGKLNHVFFVNSGSEANDTILRLARHYWTLRDQPRKQMFIGLERAYHGSTGTGVSLGGLPAMHAQGNLDIADCVRIPRPSLFDAGPVNDVNAFGLEMASLLQAKIDALGAENVAAFIAEPVQGAGGVMIPPSGWWTEIERICRANNILLVCDEVITGFGRTGHWFAHHGLNIQPDLIAFGKGLSSGYQPIAGVAVSAEIVETLRTKGGVFTHGFTFSGHPVAAAVALENIRIIEEEQLVTRVRESIGPYFANALQSLWGNPLVGDVRSIGLLGAIEIVADRETRQRFPADAKAGILCRDAARENGLIVRAIGDTIALCPPFIITEAEIDQMIDHLGSALDTVADQILR